MDQRKRKRRDRQFRDAAYRLKLKRELEVRAVAYRLQGNSAAVARQLARLDIVAQNRESAIMFLYGPTA